MRLSPLPSVPVTTLLTALLVTAAAACQSEPGAEADGDGGAGAPPAEEAAAPIREAIPAPPSTWAYTCPDGLRFPVHYRTDQVTVTLPRRQLDLPRVSGAPGARYEAGDTLFHHRAGEAVLEVGAERHAGCRGERAASPDDAARLLGFDFRGVGQEPGWLVDVDADREVRWVGDYGVVRFATGAPETVEEGDGRVVWRATGQGHEIRVAVEDAPCRDAMSGQPFTHTVRVTVDGEELDGCGEWLGER